LKKLHFLPTAVAGFSFGGMVAQELTLHFPADISALVVSACGCTFTDEVRTALRARGAAAERDSMASVLDSTMERWFTPSFRTRGLDAPARARLLTDDVQSWKKTWNAISSLDTESRLPHIHVPTLCFAAEKDLSTPPAVVKRVADAIPSARYIVMEDLSHMLFIEAPGAVARVISDFLHEAVFS
jgi:pimeloyl-ACP methyl ester carboxylesterase